MAQSYLSLWYHLVWSTKNREPMIDKAWKWELYDHIKSYCKHKAYHLDFINGTEDHVHLLISPKPIFALSDIVRDIKRDSYYWIKEQGFSAQHFSWQDGYGAFTVSISMVETVRNYIRNQEELHKKQSFEHEIEYFEKIMNSTPQKDIISKP
jgi:putative transposase